MSKDYEKAYQGSALYWGNKPNRLVTNFAEFAPEGNALDLGMGEGRDVLYLAKLGFSVTGIESTEAGVLKCMRLAGKKGLPVKTVCADVREYRIAKRRYSLISAINLFQFISKQEAAAVIAGAIDGLKKGGLFLCVTFTIDDPSYRERRRRTKEIEPGVFLDSSNNIYSLYMYRELLQMCDKLRVLYYREYDFYDTNHGQPHWHGMADFVGKKI